MSHEREKRALVELERACRDGKAVEKLAAFKEVISARAETDDHEKAELREQLEDAIALPTEIESKLTWTEVRIEELWKAAGCQPGKDVDVLIDVVRATKRQRDELRARVAVLESREQSRLPETAGEAPPFTIFRIIDPGFSDSSYLVHVDGRHLPVFHIRDNVWGQWCSRGPCACKWPDQRIAVQVCNARGLKIAADQPKEKT